MATLKFFDCLADPVVLHFQLKSSMSGLKPESAETASFYISSVPCHARLLLNHHHTEAKGFRQSFSSPFFDENFASSIVLE